MAAGADDRYFYDAAGRQIGRLESIHQLESAERIGLELKDKMASFLPAEVAASPAAATSETLRTDVLSALMNLGYHRPLAERAVDAALMHGTGTAFEGVLKHALRELAR